MDEHVFIAKCSKSDGSDAMLVYFGTLGSECERPFCKRLALISGELHCCVLLALGGRRLVAHAVTLCSVVVRSSVNFDAKPCTKKVAESGNCRAR